MDDLISRQAAIDKLKSVIADVEYTRITDEAKERIARKFFADIPSSSQPEIIRCKDCRFYNPYDITKVYDCERGLLGVLQDDYCSFGERKSE